MRIPRIPATALVVVLGLLGAVALGAFRGGDPSIRAEPVTTSSEPTTSSTGPTTSTTGVTTTSVVDGQVVRYRGLELRVPTGWPVHDLAANPSTCVRLDVHAVYLGLAGLEPRLPGPSCRAHRDRAAPADSRRCLRHSSSLGPPQAGALNGMASGPTRPRRERRPHRGVSRPGRRGDLHLRGLEHSCLRDPHGRRPRIAMTRGDRRLALVFLLAVRSGCVPAGDRSRGSSLRRRRARPPLRWGRRTATGSSTRRSTRARHPQLRKWRLDGIHPRTAASASTSVGGMPRAHPDSIPHLTAAWVTTVDQRRAGDSCRLWVGRQAPCYPGGGAKIVHEHRTAATPGNRGGQRRRRRGIGEIRHRPGHSTVHLGAPSTTTWSTTPRSDVHRRSTQRS